MTVSLGLAFSILLSSFLGSWHCAGMCGPIASLMSTRKNLLSWHLGRFVAYVLLGFAGGALGSFFLNSQFIYLRIISSILFALILLLMGLRQLKPSWFLNISFPWFRRLRKFHLNQSGFIVGLMTALLPCGWLYTYVTAAIATQSPWAGALLMTLFWLGGLPALNILPAMVRKTLQTASLRQRKIAGVILILAGVYSLGSFYLH